MTENLVNLILTLLEIADESAAQNMGLKGKPYLEFGNVPKYAFNIKKQDKEKFMKVYNRLRGSEKETFEDIMKRYSYIMEYEKKSEEIVKGL